MKQEASSFYSRYPEQTWKNVLSLGDMKYEHDAVQAIALGRSAPSRERLRTKAILLPRGPSLSELTLRLRFSRLMLPAYVSFNGNIDLDLTAARDPLEAIGRALKMPQLGELPFPRHAWGRSPSPSGEAAAEALNDVALTVHETLEDNDGPRDTSAATAPLGPSRASSPPVAAAQQPWRPLVAGPAWRVLAEGAAASACGHLLALWGARGNARAAEGLVDLAHSTYTLSVAAVASLAPQGGQEKARTLVPWAERLASTMYLRSCGHLWADAGFVAVGLATGRKPHCWPQRLLRCMVQTATNVSCLLPGAGAHQRVCFPSAGYLAEAASLPLRLTSRMAAPLSGLACTAMLAAKLANLLWCFRLIQGAHGHLSKQCVCLHLVCASLTHALGAGRLLDMARAQR